MKIIVKSDVQKKYALEQVNMLGYKEVYAVEIKRFTETRTLAQNNMLHNWLRHISKIFNDRGEFFNLYQWKIEFKRRFLGYEAINTHGGVVTELRHTSDLNTKQFTDFLEQIDLYCATHLDITDLPKPSDYNWIMGYGKKK